MKFIKSLLLGLTLGFIFLILIAISISFFYEKEVTQYIIEELNESIDVKDTKFSLLRKFPNASLEFKDVTAFSPSSFDNKILNYKTDTLFSSKRLFLEFNIFDLIKKTYKIKNIHFAGIKPWDFNSDDIETKKHMFYPVFQKWFENYAEAEGIIKKELKTT